MKLLEMNHIKKEFDMLFNPVYGYTNLYYLVSSVF